MRARSHPRARTAVTKSFPRMCAGVAGRKAFRRVSCAASSFEVVTMDELLDELSEAALGALRRGESDRADDAGFVELAGVSVAGEPLALRGESTGPAWFVTLAGLGLAVALRARDEDELQRV